MQTHVLYITLYRSVMLLSTYSHFTTVMIIPEMDQGDMHIVSNLTGLCTAVTNITSSTFVILGGIRDNDDNDCWLYDNITDLYKVMYKTWVCMHSTP